MQARRLHPAESSLLSYGLVVHLLLLSTTHRCVAVAFGYRPESVYLKRTCTSLTTRAFRRTSPAFQGREKASFPRFRRVSDVLKWGSTVAKATPAQIISSPPPFKARP